LVIKVFRVDRSLRFPQGIKAKFLLQNKEDRSLMLLMDNHEPFGFHMHTRLPHDPDHRIPVHVHDYREAIIYFKEEVRRLLENEKN